MTDSPSQTGGAQSLDSRPAPDAAPLDVLFDVLAHPRRRHALQCLRECRTPMALADLAREVAARERGTRVPDVPAEEVERVHASLYHVHVPKLADANVVEYAGERDLVALSSESERVEPFAEWAAANE